MFVFCGAFFENLTLCFLHIRKKQAGLTSSSLPFSPPSSAHPDSHFAFSSVQLPYCESDEHPLILGGF